ncbi:MAG: hypothetical protein NZ700_00390, partial [Gemmataceae bacterium]|nr:hypothetical protein [Gemmataceae bacterium]
QWRLLLLGGAMAATLVFLVGDYIACQFKTLGNPAGIAMKIAFRAHVAALAGCALQFWLEQRQAANLPPPRLDWRW